MAGSINKRDEGGTPEQGVLINNMATIGTTAILHMHREPHVVLLFNCSNTGVTFTN